MGIFKTIMNIFFDLDGTLIDSRQRLYQLFQYLVPQSRLTFDDYWNLKRNKINHESILKEYFEITEFAYFEKNWLALIEEERYLDIDQPFEGVTQYLSDLKEKEISIYVSTARQSKQGVLYQFQRFGWTNLFDDILVTEQKQNKQDLIQPYLSIYKNENWMVGDTGKDILIGKELGMKTVAVYSGFLSKEVLLEYHPDYILEKVDELQTHY